MSPTETLTALTKKRIVQANSSLNQFCVELEGGSGLRLTARMEGGTPRIDVSLEEASSLPRLSEAVCSVDWSWIENATISSITAAPQMVKFMLDPVGPLSISANIWQGSGFLAFQPYKPAKK